MDSTIYSEHSYRRGNGRRGGRIVLDHVPFVPGEKIDVVLRSHFERRPANLSGSVIRFDKPFDPAVVEDWEPPL
jgi:hypothetical protein